MLLTFLRRRLLLPLAIIALPACSGEVAPADAGHRDGASDETSIADAVADGGADVLGRTRERCNRVDDDGDGKIDEGCPIRITTDPGDDVDADLQGGRVVWNNARVTYIRTLPSGAIERLPFFCAAPSLWGARLACIGDGEYLVYDLAAFTRTRVDTTDSAGLLWPRLHGDILAWTQYMVGEGNSENTEVWARDLATGQTVRVTNDAAISLSARVDGRALAWSDDRRGHHAIFFAHQFDVFTTTLGAAQPERAVTNRAGDLQIGSVMGFERGRVLVTDSYQPWIAAPPPARCQPVFYDVATGARTELSPLDERCDEAAALSGNRVAVLFDRLGVSDIFLIDASTHQRRRVTNYPRRSERPLLDGDLLVWSDDRNDNWDLYMMDVSDIEVGDLSPEGVTP